MKIRSCLTMVLVSALVACGCAPKGSTSGSDSGVERQQYSVTIGQTVRAVLVSNRTTGFEWAVNADASEGMKHITITRSGYVDTDSADGVVGAPGRQWWAITGVSTGTAMIHLDYRRSWETDVPPARKAIITIHVPQ